MRCDVLVVGAGIAGTGVAAFLADRARVVVIEAEERPGVHSTGRSAAQFTETYGPAPIRALTAASRAFFEAPPPGFSDHPLLTPRGVLAIAPVGRSDELDRHLKETSVHARGLVAVDPGEAGRLFPALRVEAIAGGVFEPGARDLDVAAIHAGYQRMIRASGGRILLSVRFESARRDGNGWAVETSAGPIATGIIVDAAGAWADEVAVHAGVAPIGLVPKRRTAAIAHPEPAEAWERWPMVFDLGGTVYFKPESGGMLVSPADETPVEPCDAQPDDLDVAIAVDRMEKLTRWRVRRVSHRWAGLRSFVGDGVPVAGHAPDTDGFFWLAGQGGYGIQTSPALSRLAAALVMGERVPADLADRGILAETLTPGRPALSGAPACDGPSA